MSAAVIEICSFCRGREFVDATDNFGLPYRGCARCRLMTLEEIDAIIKAGRK